MSHPTDAATVGDPQPPEPWNRTPSVHAAHIANRARRLIHEKYMAGQREHGGQLWRKTGIVDMAIDEAVDQVIYLLTLRDQLAEAGVILGDLTE